MCDGIPAGERVTWCIKNLGLSSEEARPPICIVVSKSPYFVYFMFQGEMPVAFCFVRQRVMREYCANFGERAGITAAAWHESFAFGHALWEATARKVFPFSAAWRLSRRFASNQSSLVFCSCLLSVIFDSKDMNCS